MFGTNTMKVLLYSCTSAYLVDKYHHLGVWDGLQVSFGHIDGGAGLPTSGWQPYDYVFTLESPLNHLLLVLVQPKLARHPSGSSRIAE